MWVHLYDSFLSIVHQSKRNVLVRSRKTGDIERIFPAATVRYTPERDYPYRAVIARSAVARALTEEVKTLRYSNFKDSVSERSRQGAYAQCWNVMALWGDDEGGLRQKPQPHLSALPWLPLLDEQENGHENETDDCYAGIAR